jgi:hypothetical protein
MNSPCLVYSSGAILSLAVLITGCTPTVPSVVGQPLPNAEEKLRQAGLKASIRRETGFNAPSGSVVSQNPKAGTGVKQDSVVSLVVTEKPTLTGSFTLIDTDISRDQGDCIGTGGYSDIKAGLQVVVKSEKGEILAVGELGRDNYSGQYPEVACEFPFTISNLPKANFYEIEVGRRGGLKYSLDELRKAGWAVKFQLGGS